MRKPTFVLKPQAYKTNKLYAQVPHDGTGDMTPGVYAGNGTRVNKYGLIEAVASDVPRIDYLDGVGLLLEPTRENVVTRSYDFSLWTTSNATFTASAAVAPNGERQATKIESASGTTLASPSEEWSATGGVVHAISIFIKPAGTDTAYVGFGSSGSVTETAFLSITDKGEISLYSDSNGIMIDWGYERHINGWYRLWMAVDVDATNTNVRIIIYPTGFNPEETGYIYAWGAQAEEGYFPTSYIQTTGAAVTRAYDEMTLSNIFTLGLMSSGAGAFFADIDCITAIPAASGPLCRINSGAGSITISNNTSSPYKTRALVINNSAATSGSYNIEQGRNRVLFNVFGSGTDVWLNGTRVINDTTDVYLAGSTLLATGQFTKWKLRQMTIWDSPLNNTESKAITQS